MPVFNKFEQFVEDLANGVHDLGSDTLKVALSNTEPDPTDSTLFDITEITAENGYDAGGATLTVTSSAQDTGTYKLVIEDETFIATGNIGPFTYVVLYNETPAGDPLIGWWELADAETLSDTETFTVDFSATNGVLQLA